MKKNTQKISPYKKGFFKSFFLPFISIVIIFLLSFILYSSYQNFKKGKPSTKPFVIEEQEQKDLWITVFTHGAFGSILGLLNTMQVIHDQITGTQYKKLINQMRKNPYFYQTQPILQKGLIKIEPSFNLEISKNKKYVIYPISKAFEKISKLISPKKEKNLFYTFGWSGLMSQTQRRKEAIRFYNILSDEITKYNNQGIYPKIRIIAHSHGGNLSLNLAAVKTCLNNLNNTKIIKEIAQSDDDLKSLEQMTTILKALPAREKVKNQKGQKAFDFKPTKQDLFIDELIILGTPIQPETKYLALHDCFKKVYSFYSDEDIVQKMDWVSTRRYYSDQRLDFSEQIKNKQGLSKITQVKIMIGRKIEPIETKTETGLDNKLALTIKPEEEKTLSFWDRIVFAAKNLFHKTTQDPTHRELWFICWDQDDNFSHLPTVIFTPAILSAIKDMSSQNNDLDLNITFTEQELSFYVSKHNEKKVENKISIFRKTIDKIKSKIKQWKPEDVSYTKEFEIIKSYSNNI